MVGDIFENASWNLEEISIEIPKNILDLLLSILGDLTNQFTLILLHILFWRITS